VRRVPALGGGLVGRLTGEEAAVAVAGIAVERGLGLASAGVLPNLPLVIPVEAKQGEPGSNLAGLLVGEGNPDPCADNLGLVEEVRGLLPQEGQKRGSGKLPVVVPGVEVNPGRADSAGQVWAVVAVRVSPDSAFALS
jgi:hypothetical protein